MGLTWQAERLEIKQNESLMSATHPGGSFKKRSIWISESLGEIRGRSEDHVPKSERQRPLFLQEQQKAGECH